MGNVFESNPPGYGRKKKPTSRVSIRTKILRTLENGWISTSGIYDATSRNVRRSVLHDELMRLLEENVIRIRVIDMTDGRPRTEFSLTPNAEVTGA
jgi:hypothetical protein